MVWNLWYSSWLVYIVFERTMAKGKNSGLYFWWGLYIFCCNPGLCHWTYTFYPIYCSPQSRHRWAWCRTSSLCQWHTNLYISIRFWSFRFPNWFEILCYWCFDLDDKFEAKPIPSKTEFIIIGSKKQREKFRDLFPILLLDHDTLPKAFVRNLGFIFACDFNFKRQISQTCKICFYHIRDFRRIRKYLSPEAAKAVACALVTSHLDYCNSRLYNLPDRDIERLQRVQNCLARVVCKASRFSRSKPLLYFLHWLPVKYRIRFKLCTITFKAFLFHQPTYL